MRESNIPLACTYVAADCLPRRLLLAAKYGQPGQPAEVMALKVLTPHTHKQAMLLLDPTIRVDGECGRVLLCSLWHMARRNWTGDLAGWLAASEN